MFKNKHVVVAMLVAPILAVIAWFAVDYLVAERAKPARSGTTYPLVAKSNCRYDSGRCDLKNEDLEVSLRPTAIDASGISLELSSVFPLTRAMVGVVEGDAEQAPAGFTAANSDQTEWTGRIARPASQESQLRVAIVANGATFFAEVPVVFLVIKD